MLARGSGLARLERHQAEITALNEKLMKGQEEVSGVLPLLQVLELAAIARSLPKGARLYDETCCCRWRISKITQR